MDVVAQALANHPGVRLAHLPTPLEARENLSERLGGPRLFVKRDDCTGVAMGDTYLNSGNVLLDRLLSR